MDFFSREAGQARRNALVDSLNELAYFVPPELRPWLGIANELNPFVSMERAGTNALAATDPNATGWQRVQAVGDMASNMAGAVSSIVGASRGAVPAAQAVEDALMGWSASSPMAFAARDFATDEFGGVGFRAYHGSPHDFDRFSLDKIGTGEGAQAYGHGLYFADSEDVARGYRDALRFPRMDSIATPRDAVIDDLNYHRGNVEGVRNSYQSMIASGNPVAAKMGAEKLALLDSVVADNPGRMYEVQINADPNDFLDWDKPLSEQPAAVRDALGPRVDALRQAGAGIPQDPIGEALWRVAHPQGGFDKTDFSRSVPEQAAERLRSAGIPGIRYLDAGSRGAGDGSRNYVVFDDKLIEIIRKYGWAAAAPIFAASGLTVEEARAQYEGQM